MAKIPFTISSAPSITNDLIAVVYEEVDNGIGPEVAREVDDSDHSSPRNFQFNDLQPGNYIVRIHESPDGVTLGNLRHDFWVDAVTENLLLDRRFYLVDGEDEFDPAPDTVVIADPYFIGKTITGLFQQGNRYLDSGKGEWSVNVDGEIILGIDSTSGTQIKNWENTKWAVEITYPQLASGSPSQLYGDIMLLTTNTTLSSEHWNHDLYVRGASSKLTVTMPALASIPENKGFCLVHDGGTVVNVLLQMQSGEIVRFRGDNRNDLRLAKGDTIECVKKTISGTAYLFAKAIYGNWERIGEIVGLRKTSGNSYSLADPVTEYDLTVHLRLAEYINSLPPAQVVTYFAFDTTTVVEGEAVYTNRGFFAVDNVNNKARLPDYLNKAIRFLKNDGGADATRVNNIPGGYQHWKVGQLDFTLQVPKGHSYGGGPNVLRSGNGASNPTDIAWPQTFNAGQETTGRNIGLLPFLLV